MHAQVNLMLCELLFSIKRFKIKPALSPYKAQEIIHKQIKNELLTPTITMAYIAQSPTIWRVAIIYFTSLWIQQIMAANTSI